MRCMFPDPVGSDVYHGILLKTASRGLCKEHSVICAGVGLASVDFGEPWRVVELIAFAYPKVHLGMCY